MTAARGTPNFVYKIYPKLETFQIPVPQSADYIFPQDSLDKSSGYFHMSAQDQMDDTLTLFFDAVETVQLVKIDYVRLNEAETVKWELAPDNNAYPHLFALLDGKYVVDVKAVDKGASWTETVKKLADENWLEY
ncbi:hypothetical protein CVT26_000146 [Gymnopilus dilepis]|uniref:Uncharacterized protein n=1 Tax=Gymnopilus dilepis TaxID=231916 RepID=A0A409WDZ8_9AGAR|nr:hypothetical protein CVT26_000146 [Gymnopilus dilepis]